MHRIEKEDGIASRFTHQCLPLYFESEKKKILTTNVCLVPELVSFYKETISKLL